MTQMEYYQYKLTYEIDSADLFDDLRNGENVIVVDTRTKQSYFQEHIAEAINIPHRDITETSTKHLSRSALYVTYCDGIGCNGSTKGALKMCQLGFKVKELLGGIEWWKKDGFATTGSRSKEGAATSCSC